MSLFSLAAFTNHDRNDEEPVKSLKQDFHVRSLIAHARHDWLCQTSQEGVPKKLGKQEYQETTTEIRQCNWPVSKGNIDSLAYLPKGDFSKGTASLGATPV